MTMDPNSQLSSQKHFNASLTSQLNANVVMTSLGTARFAHVRAALLNPRSIHPRVWILLNAKIAEAAYPKLLFE
jgi:hypothetical protein